MTDAKLRDALRASEQKRRDYRDEARRCRAIAKMLCDKLEIHAVLAEVMPYNDNRGIRIFICAPNLNEHNFGEAGVLLLRELWERSGVDVDKDVVVSDLGVQGTMADAAERKRTP